MPRLCRWRRVALTGAIVLGICGGALAQTKQQPAPATGTVGTGTTAGTSTEPPACKITITPKDNRCPFEKVEICPGKRPKKTCVDRNGQ